MYRTILLCVILGAGKLFLDHYNNVQRHIEQTDELLRIVKETNQIVKNSKKDWVIKFLT